MKISEAEINDLSAQIEEIEKIASNIKAGANESRMNFLEAKGVEALVSEIYQAAGSHVKYAEEILKKIRAEQEDSH